MKKLFSLFVVAFMAMGLAATPATQLKNLTDAPAQSTNQLRALRLINQDVTKRANHAAVAEKSFKKQSEFLQNNVKDLYENYKLNIEITRNNLNNEHVHLYPDKKDRYDVENNEPL